MKPSVFYVEQDGSILCEFIHPQFRIGLCLDPDLGQSSWYVVSNLKGVDGACDYFDPDNLGEMLARIYQFYVNIAITFDEVADKGLNNITTIVEVEIWNDMY